MVNLSVISRCAVLATAAALAMPYATSASHVAGGDDVPNCDTSTLQPSPCSRIAGHACTLMKQQCFACIKDYPIKQYKCTTTNTAACGDPVNCVSGQTDSALSPDSCIAIPCD